MSCKKPGRPKSPWRLLFTLASYYASYASWNITLPRHHTVGVVDQRLSPLEFVRRRWQLTDGRRVSIFYGRI